MTTASSHTESTRGDIGQGLYSLAELRAFLALSGEKSDGARVYPWLSGALNPVERTPRQPDHSFSDLVSLFVVRELVRHGVAMATIREAEAHLREVWDTDRPFIYDVIQTDGRDVFADGARITGQVEAASRSQYSKKRGQQVMLEVVRDLLHDVHYVDGLAQWWAPGEGVVVNPLIQFGEPVLDGTRLPTAVVADVARDDLEAAANRFGITADQARDAVAFERRLAAARN